jgi:hypothetical protein
MEPWATAVIGIVLLLAAYWLYSQPAGSSAGGTGSTTITSPDGRRTLTILGGRNTVSASQ